VDNNPASARQLALNLLARREYAREELRQKLLRRCEAADVDAALEGLAAQGLQSDQRYAQAYVRERALRGYGPLRIRAELQQRRIDADTAQAALSEVAEREGIDWAAQAARALQRKFGSATLPADYAQRARYLRFLQYRGFASDSLADDAG
jgi:regulatory protein